jgi:hypothetical protein
VKWQGYYPIQRPEAVTSGNGITQASAKPDAHFLVPFVFKGM